MRVEAFYALAGAWLVAAGVLLVRAQDRVFEEEFLVANLKSVAARRALALVEAQGVRNPTVLFEDPDLDLLVEARAERRFVHLLDVTRVFERPIEPLERKNGQWGPRSPFAREVFEYFARRPRTAPAVERLLMAEADSGAGTYMRFFFDPRDFWTTITDGRRARLNDVRALVPAIREAYEAVPRSRGSLLVASGRRSHTTECGRARESALDGTAARGSDRRAREAAHEHARLPAGASERGRALGDLPDPRS